MSAFDDLLESAWIENREAREWTICRLEYVTTFKGYKCAVRSRNSDGLWDCVRVTVRGRVWECHIRPTYFLVDAQMICEEFVRGLSSV